MNDRAAHSRTLPVRNPFTRETVGTVPMASAEDVRRAIATAHAYRPTLTRFARAEALRKAAALLRSRAEAA
jgi:acyl-CoA reductase-like NAD-dependent aldehyde dehydrogenase